MSQILFAGLWAWVIAQACFLWWGWGCNHIDQYKIRVCASVLYYSASVTLWRQHGHTAACSKVRNCGGRQIFLLRSLLETEDSSLTHCLRHQQTKRETMADDAKFRSVFLLWRLPHSIILYAHWFDLFGKKHLRRQGEALCCALPLTPAAWLTE
jgi:hypothetical protein